MELNPGAGWTIGGGARLFSKTVGSEVTVEAQPTAADGSTGAWRIVAGGEGWSGDPCLSRASRGRSSSID